MLWKSGGIIMKTLKEAKEIIPGGTQLLSKRSEIYPQYYSKAKGCEVWDLEGKKYIDFASMGIGTCLLGYADDDVNEAVKECIDKGSMSTLNPPEEYELAELLLKLHPRMGMIRYARTGGEAMCIAVRTARAYTGRDKVAFCGYHGWHDWYLAANLVVPTKLDIHLLPNLPIKGVPKCLKGTAIPFELDEIEQLREILKDKEIGTVVIEVMRHKYPMPYFFEEVRRLATENDVVLIFDEITIGWRDRITEIIPDIVVYAKGISNGYPMAVVMGKKEVMEAINETFISSTYWTERIGPTAALATINKLIKCNVIGHINNIGLMIWKGWLRLAKKHKLNISVLPPPALITFKFNYPNVTELAEIFSREMLRLGYIAGMSVYVTYAHTEEIVIKYLENVDKVFKKISDYLWIKLKK